MSEADYTELTYEYTLAAARALKDAGAGSADKTFRFLFISGELADPTGKSSQMWARVKVRLSIEIPIPMPTEPPPQGRVERELPELFKGTNISAHVYRPGYFFPSKEYPDDRLNQRGATMRVLDNIMTPLYKTLTPSLYSPIDELGRFAVEVAKGRWPHQELFRNADMRKLMRDVPPLDTSDASKARDEL